MASICAGPEQRGRALGQQVDGDRGGKRGQLAVGRLIDRQIGCAGYLDPEAAARSRVAGHNEQRLALGVGDLLGVGDEHRILEIAQRDADRLDRQRRLGHGVDHGRGYGLLRRGLLRHSYGGCTAKAQQQNHP